MKNGIQVVHPIEVLHAGGAVLACGLDGQMEADSLHGLFVGDTRVLSTYRIMVGGRPWQLVSRSRKGRATALWHFQNTGIRDALGDIPEGTLLFSLRRRVDGAVHDDLQISSYAGRSCNLRLMIQIDGDFSDIFEVKEQSIPPRLNVNRATRESGFVLVYRRGDFCRAVNVLFDADGPAPEFVGSSVAFDIALDSGHQWACCIEISPEIAGRRLRFSSDPHEPDKDPVPEAHQIKIVSLPILSMPFERGLNDLHALAVQQEGAPPYVAAGVPWFLTLFGRDTLVTSLMSGLDGTWLAEGAMAALSRLQAKDRDDWRDAEPGKFPHEMRHGELATCGIIPHSPYYGTHDAPALFCLALWNAWRWSGNPDLLERYLPSALRAMEWCDHLGDRDGDGLLEYQTRSPVGYRNQSWKDAFDAIVNEDGSLADTPLATVEMQGYWYAARLALAELLEERGEWEPADRLREKARSLRKIVEERYWMEDRDSYAMALDRDKRLVRTVSSNPGHLLWCGLPDHERAERQGARLLRPDMFSGWGLRTYTWENPAYNPLGYQSGSVWPHDTILAAAGLRRYGLFELSDRLIEAILLAATSFEQTRLPELFCGLASTYGLPIPYGKANSPQAWAAASSLLVAQILLGLVPDAPRGRCFLAPRLPLWLPRLELRGILVGKRTLEISIFQESGETYVEWLHADGIEVVFGTPEAPLWGAPMSRLNQVPADKGRR